MDITQSSAAEPMRNWKWSPAAKAIAHKAFDKALKKELDELVRVAKSRAARIKDVAELWKLERLLGERRREIDNTFDFRYSVLPLVFAGLLRDGRLDESDLTGLSDEKLHAIRFIASRAE